MITQLVAFLSFIGLSFLYIETKELCEARVKLEMSSNFQMTFPQMDSLPPSETASERSELFADLCHQ